MRASLKSEHFRILGETGPATDEDMHQSRQAIKEAQAQEIELDEARQGRRDELGNASAPPSRQNWGWETLVRAQGASG